WVKGSYTFTRTTGDTPRGLQHLRVWECEKPRLWTVERLSESRPYRSDEVLVHQFGSTPIFTRSYQSAMRLATFCHENGPPDGLRWISACPEDGKDAVEFARERNITEALVRRNAHHEDHLRGAA